VPLLACPATLSTQAPRKQRGRCFATPGHRGLATAATMPLSLRLFGAALCRRHAPLQVTWPLSPLARCARCTRSKGEPRAAGCEHATPVLRGGHSCHSARGVPDAVWCPASRVVVAMRVRRVGRAAPLTRPAVSLQHRSKASIRYVLPSRRAVQRRVPVACQVHGICPSDPMTLGWDRGC